MVTLDEPSLRGTPIAWLHLYQSTVIYCEIVVFPPTILTTETTVNPRQAGFINLRDTKRTTASDQLLVNPHRVTVDVVTFLKKLRRYLNEPDFVADPQVTP